MENEISHGNVTHVASKGKPESPRVTCSDSNTTINNNHNSGNNNKEQDRFLPIANVSRILKKVIPSNGKISKDAKETIQECVSEFISFVTGEASDKCQREKRKTINGDDIIWAITTLGFEEYVGPLKLYLSKYREIEDEKLIFPKQQRPELQKQHHHHHQQQQQQLVRQQKSEYEQNLGFSNNNNNVYSSLNVLSNHHHLHHHHPPFLPTEQPFSLPFSSDSFQKQLQ
ncbi:nuclear transcription factor Y subunit B-7-like [Hibiscus syriacus]|uniref:nuclear transcription factor Y subunit B-7-like n=1 Tax=Hibiscus syriacus TaxID=106335 RepID=UPI001922BA0D|nr:nuclear transcription factor Y subunit B-7-like [Hibiscus syriacus]